VSPRDELAHEPINHLQQSEGDKHNEQQLPDGVCEESGPGVGVQGGLHSGSPFQWEWTGAQAQPLDVANSPRYALWAHPCLGQTMSRRSGFRLVANNMFKRNGLQPERAFGTSVGLRTFDCDFRGAITILLWIEDAWRSFGHFVEGLELVEMFLRFCPQNGVGENAVAVD
jgi:hypothetical protein